MFCRANIAEKLENIKVIKLNKSTMKNRDTLSRDGYMIYIIILINN